MKSQQKWPQEKRDELTRLCIAGEMSNKELAAHFDVPLAEIHGVRSRLGITRDKCKLASGEAAVKVEPTAILDQFSTKDLIQELLKRKTVFLASEHNHVLLIGRGNIE